MNKKYIIGVCIAVLVWGGFMFYRHHRNKGDITDYMEQANRQITEAAKKAPRAGLAEIGSAIEGYHKENQAYPSRLMDLYPKYLANKSLIQEIDWYYKPRGNDFYLSKTLTLGNKRIVASIDRDLRPQAEAGAMVATPSPVPIAEAIKKPKWAEKPETSERTRLALAREAFLQALRHGRMRVTSVSLPEMDEARFIATVQPEVFSIMESDIRSDLESELSQRYLIWKGDNGVLGFSNVQYPDADSLSIFAFGRWYNIKIPLGKGHEAVGLKAEAARKKERPEMMALNLNSSYLVWKDKYGALGFGNVQYPEKDLESVFQTDGWVSMKSPALVATKTGMEEKHGSRKKKSPETIASEFSASCLVWKDRHGTVGFGNVQYPEKDLESVFQTDGWVSMKRPSTAKETTVEENQGMPKRGSAQKTHSELFARYFVWKDKHGALGFGNIQYPDSRGISHVHLNGSWEPVAN